MKIYHRQHSMYNSHTTGDVVRHIVSIHKRYMIISIVSHRHSLYVLYIGNIVVMYCFYILMINM